MEIMIEKHGATELEALDQIRNSVDKAPSGTYKPIFINDFRAAKDVKEILSSIAKKIKDNTVQDMIDTLPPLEGKKSATAGEIEPQQESSQPEETDD